MRRSFLAVATLVACGGAVFAQNAPPKSDNPNVVTLSRGSTVAAAVASAAKTANAIAVVDPMVAGSVSAAVARQPLEQMLASIAASQKAEWRKVYLTDAEIPRKADGTVDAAKLKTMVEAASLAPAATIGVVDPQSGQIAITTRTPITSPQTQEWLKTRRPVYVLFRPSILGGSADPVADYLTVQKNSMESFVKMTPEQRSAAMKQGIEMFLNADPQMMGQMMQQQMQAFMDLPPETKAKLMEVGMKMMGGMAGGGNPPPPPPPPPGQ